MTRRVDPAEAEAEAFARAAILRVLASTRARVPQVAAIGTLSRPWARAVRRLVAEERIERVRSRRSPDVAIGTAVLRYDLERVVAEGLGGLLRPRAHLLVGSTLDVLVGLPMDRAAFARWIPHAIVCADARRAAAWYSAALRPTDGFPRLAFVAPSLPDGRR